MTIKYLVTEIQTFENGQITTPSYAFDNRNSAESKFYSIMSAAAVPSLPCFAVVLYTNEGQVLNHGMYRHGTEE